MCVRETSGKPVALVLKRVLSSRLVSLAILCLLALPIGIRAQSEDPKNWASKRYVTVQDAINTTRLAGSNYFRGGDSKGRVAQFSPDGRSFVIVLRKGNLEKNTNEFSLLLYETADALQAPKPTILLRMSSSSNREAISQIKWLADSRTILFIGENPGEISQIYEFNIPKKRLRRRTTSSAPITDFDCTSDGRTILFRTETPHGQFGSPEKELIQHQGIVITDQSLQDLLAGRYGHPDWGDLFLQQQGHEPVNLPIREGYYVLGQSLSVAPDGQHALIRAGLLKKGIPRSWAEYDFGRYNGGLHVFFNLQNDSWTTAFQQFLLLDIVDHSMKPLWDAPVTWGPNPAVWAKDGKSVVLPGTHLPLEDTSGEERQLRKRELYDVAISIDTCKFRKISKEEVPQPQAPVSQLDVTLEEDPNTPPKIFVRDQKTNKKAMLLDLNPQFGELQLGKVETIEWTADGVKLIAGLYLPPDYTPEHKYPLVIQTHGFSRQRFSMDGMNEWSSGFAARPLAAHDLLVLQLQETVSPYDYEGGDAKRFGITASQAARNLNVRGIETAIDYLDAKGIIDKERIGIVGFSRSVAFVGYLLTHSTRHFAAASLVNGIDGGYFQELVYPQFASEKDDMFGGATPFGDGLGTWLSESPSFSLGKVNTPLRLLALGNSTDVSELWEWFASLLLQRKPVEYVFLPDAAHLVVKPWERMITQQGLVDWFRFWLKDEEDPDAAKVEQYARWRQLRARESQATKANTLLDGRLSETK